jgi:hypothetical protein
MRLCPGWTLDRLTLVLLLAAVLPLRVSLAAALEISAEVGGRFESNVSNSNLASDQLADGFFTARLDAGTGGVWGRDWRWHAYLAGEGDQAFRFTELSQIEGGIHLGVERKFGLGWSAPRLRLDLDSGYPLHSSMALPAKARYFIRRTRRRRVCGRGSNRGLTIGMRLRKTYRFQISSAEA